MTIDYKITSPKGANMLQCVLYIFLSGATMLSNGCAPIDGVYYADRVEYVESYSPPSYVRHSSPKYGTQLPYNYWYSHGGSYYYAPRKSYNSNRYRHRHQNRYRTYSNNYRRYRHKTTYRHRPYTKITPPPPSAKKPRKKGKKKWRKH